MALSVSPPTHTNVPKNKSRLRSVRSPQYPQATDDTAATRIEAPVMKTMADFDVASSSEIGVTIAGMAPMAALSSEASTMNTTTVNTRCGVDPHQEGRRAIAERVPSAGAGIRYLSTASTKAPVRTS